MGLTIHYSIEAKTTSSTRAKALVEQMRKLSAKYPFEQGAGEIRHYSHAPANPAPPCNLGTWIKSPWGNADRHCYIDVFPVEAFTFLVEPADGSESLDLGLARYPATIEANWSPRDDARFVKTIKQGGSTSWQFDHAAFRRWEKRKYPGEWRSPEECGEKRKIRTGLGKGWRYGSFCKTQYASSPECGGLANFLLGHIASVSLLEEIGRLPEVAVHIDDEGHYGPSHYSDDHREAREAGREPTYVDHPATHDVGTLAMQVHDANIRVAALHQALQGMWGGGVESPIASYSNVAELKLEGERSEDLQPFLAAMKAVALEERSKQPSAAE